LFILKQQKVGLTGTIVSSDTIVLEISYICLFTSKYKMYQRYI